VCRNYWQFYPKITNHQSFLLANISSCTVYVYVHIKTSLTGERNAACDLLNDEVFTSDSSSVYSFDAPSFSPINSLNGSTSATSTSEKGCVYFVA